MAKAVKAVKPAKPVGAEEKSVGPSGIVWNNEKRRFGDLSEWDRNPRTITDEQAKHLATSIIKFGYVEPVQINKDDRIIGGHQRSRIMRQAGLLKDDTVIDVRVPSRLLSEEEHEELAIRLNKNTGKWDWDKLASDFDQTSLRDWGFSPMDFGMISKDVKMKPTDLKPAEAKVCPACGAVLP
jgi:ParB-like chromosome segregation protein Spo0J